MRKPCTFTPQANLEMEATTEVGNPSGGSRIFERGFQFQLDKNASSVVELKTKKKKNKQKKVINLHTSLLAVLYWMISNKTTVIRASQSDCSIRGGVSI